MGEVAVIVTTRCQPGERSAVERLYREMLGPRAEENAMQEVVVFCCDQDDPDVFHLFEIYSDAAALAANADAAWFAEYMEAVGPHLAGEPAVVIAAPTWSTGL